MARQRQPGGGLGEKADVKPAKKASIKAVRVSAPALPKLRKARAKRMAEKAVVKVSARAKPKPRKEKAEKPPRLASKPAKRRRVLPRPATKVAMPIEPLLKRL